MLLYSHIAITFTGSDQKSCENCWNKIKSKKILIENQLPTPEYIVSSQNMKIDPDTDFLNYQGGFFVKPNCNGSSLGISKIKNKGNESLPLEAGPPAPRRSSALLR